MDQATSSSWKTRLHRNTYLELYKNVYQRKLSMNGKNMTPRQGSQASTQALTLKGQLQDNKD